MFPLSVEVDDRIRQAVVLMEIGELFDAETRVVEVLEERPDDLTALDVFAKIKHMRGELSVAVACWARIHASSPQNEPRPPRGPKSSPPIGIRSKKDRRSAGRAPA